MGRNSYLWTIFSVCIFLFPACGGDTPESESDPDSDSDSDSDGGCQCADFDESRVDGCYGTLSSGGSLVWGDAGATCGGSTVAVYQVNSDGGETEVGSATAAEDGSFSAVVLIRRWATVRLVSRCCEHCEPGEMTLMVCELC